MAFYPSTGYYPGVTSIASPYGGAFAAPAYSSQIMAPLTTPMSGSLIGTGYGVPVARRSFTYGTTAIGGYAAPAYSTIAAPAYSTIAAPAYSTIAAPIARRSFTYGAPVMASAPVYAAPAPYVSALPMARRSMTYMNTGIAPPPIAVSVTNPAVSGIYGASPYGPATSFYGGY